MNKIGQLMVTLKIDCTGLLVLVCHDGIVNVVCAIDHM